MSETETPVPMDSKALFDAAISDDAPAQTEAPAQEVVTTEAKPEGEQPRDEHGRFAPKAEPEQPAAQTAPEQPAKTEAPPAQPAGDVIPPWRLREEAEARRQAESRAQQLQSEVHRISTRLQQLEKPQEPIDPYADPEKFRDAGVKQAIDPIAKQLSETREYFSRKTAIATYGQETVQAAYKWLEQAAQAGDPKVAPLLQRVTQSIDPFEEVVSAYKRDKALSTVGDDPEKWFEAELERRKSDPEFAKKHLGQAPKPNGATPQNVVIMPPSLNRQPGTAGNSSPGTLDDADLYQHAIR